MSESRDSIKRIARGSGMAMIGIAAGLVLNFIARFIIARYGGQSFYGVFSLALVLLNLAMALATLGLRQGATRHIAFFRGKDDAVRVNGTISVSLKLTIAAGICLGIGIFAAADIISTEIFHMYELTVALRIFAVSIPFFALINVLAAIFRGFDRIKPQLYFEYVMVNVLFLVGLEAIVIAGLPFDTVFYAYLTSIVVTFVVFMMYTFKQLPQRPSLIDRKNTAPISKELLYFSLPLLGVMMLAMLMNWINTLMLGYFRAPADVGLYNAAYPLALFISEPLVALLLIYTPVATGLYSRNQLSELRRNYTILTKWLMSITLPIFLVLFLFSKTVIILFFGADYVEAVPTLKVLAVGFIISNLLGPNRGTLVAMGHARFLMWTTLATVILNMVLNFLLIPSMGIVGAAIASAISIVSVNVIRSIKLYTLCKAQPISKNLLKPAIASVLLAFLIDNLVSAVVDISWWALPLLFVLYYGIYAVATLLTKSFDEEDMTMLSEIENRSGINATPIKRILGRFL